MHRFLYQRLWARQKGIQMSANSKRVSAKEKEVDEATSTACTRSGTLAMTLSVALLCLIPYWQHRPTAEALAGYFTSRFLLDMNLGQLNQNPAWQYYKESRKDADLISISRLPKNFTYPPPQWKPQSDTPPSSTPEIGPVHAISQKSASFQRVASAVQKLRLTHRIAAQLPPSSSPNAPPPPTGLTASVVGPLSELDEIAVLSKQLKDSKQLINASHYSNYYLISISRWIQKKRMLAWNDQLQGRCPIKPIDLPAREGSPSEPDPEVMFDCLTIRDWTQLAAYEMPSAGSAEQNQIGDGIGKPVDINVGSLPRRGDLASYVAGAMLIFTLLYFGAFLREAIHSTHFPAEATLFSTFSRTPFANLAMLLALIFPLLSTVTLAIVSKRWFLYLEAVLLGLITIWAFLGFQQKSYFKAAFSLFRTRPKH
jgi:hypothetical protein